MSDEQTGPVDNSHRDGAIAAKAAIAAQANDRQGEPAATAVTESDADEAQDEGEDTEGAATSDPGDAPAKPGKKPGVHQRIDELTKEKYEARREAETLRKELEAVKAAKAPNPARVPAQANTRPTLEQYDFDTEAHADAVEKWASEKASRAIEAKQQEAAQAVVKAKFEARIADLEKAEPGAWAAAVAAPINVTPAMLEVISTSDKGPQIAVFLSRNLEEADRISKLSPYAAAAAIGRIEASLSAVRSPDPKSATRAPAPVTTLSGSPSVRKSYDDMSMAEYDAARRKERAAKGL